MNDRNFEAGAELVLAYKAWHQTEEQRQQDDGDGIEIIDFNLVSNSILRKMVSSRRQAKINSGCSTREGALDYLRELGERFNGQTLDGQFMKYRIIASTHYVRAIENPDQIFPLNSYLEATLGLEEGSRIGTNLISGSEIEAERVSVSKLFEDLGYPFNREGWNRFVKENPTTPQSAFKEFKTAEPKLIAIVMRNLGLVDTPKYRTEFTQEDAYWMAWAKGTPNENLLRLNTHPRVMHRWTPGSAERLIIHEVGGHIVQAVTWQRSVLSGEINPGYGITVIPGPEQWHSEGFADSLHRFMPELFEALSPAGRFAAEYSLLTDMVKRNAHIGANTDPERREQIIGRVLEILPSETRETIEIDLGERLRDPRTRAYLISYGGSYEHSLYAALPPYERRQLIRDMYKQPMTPAQIQAKYEHLSSILNPVIPPSARVEQVFSELVRHTAANSHIVNPI